MKVSTLTISVSLIKNTYKPTEKFRSMTKNTCKPIEKFSSTITQILHNIHANGFNRKCETVQYCIVQSIQRYISYVSQIWGRKPKLYTCCVPTIPSQKIPKYCTHISYLWNLLRQECIMMNGPRWQSPSCNNMK